MEHYLNNPKAIVLLGYPLAHSQSPRLHNAAFKALNLDYVYFSMPIDPKELVKFGPDFLKVLPLTGGNVTVPFKEKVFNFLDKISEEASLIGAVNTFYRKDGLLLGENTDWLGFIDSVKGLEYHFYNKRVLLMGTGGSAKAVTAALAKLEVSGIDVVGREPHNSLYFSENKKNLYPEIKWKSFTYADLSDLDKYSAVINTTPVGMYENESVLSEKCIQQLNKECLVYDLIYNPPKTRLLLMAEKHGLKIINGKGMLVHQAARAFKLWTGKDFPYHTVYAE